MFVFTIFDEIVGGLFAKRRRRNREQQVAEIRARGVTAPAVVVRATTHASRKSSDGHEIRVNYTVDVGAPNGQVFRAEFLHWEPRRSYTAVAGELQGDAGRHIWVTYDPAQPSDMIFEYDEAQRAVLTAEAELDARRSEFNRLAEPLGELRANGLPAEAAIVEAVDLQLPYPRRNSTAMTLHVDVKRSADPPYRATIPALIAVPALAKYSAGRRVFVLIDPSDPQRVVLDATRNASLPG
ncbi:MAG TPA: hypothetical protein DCR14_03160 [Acidimicrobiaceae bacterium]|nr:hypothetical protein [Acidimicrobiaceae bacterium]